MEAVRIADEALTAGPVDARLSAPAAWDADVEFITSEPIATLAPIRGGTARLRRNGTRLAGVIDAVQPVAAVLDAAATRLVQSKTVLAKANLIATVSITTGQPVAIARPTRLPRDAAAFAVSGVIADQPVAAGRCHTLTTGFMHLAALPARLGFVTDEAKTARDIGAGLVVRAAVGAVPASIAVQAIATGVLIVAVGVQAAAILTRPEFAERAIAAVQAIPKAVAAVLATAPAPTAVPTGVTRQPRAAWLPVRGVAEPLCPPAGCWG